MLHSPANRKSGFYSSLLLGLSTFLFLGWIIWLCQFGFDITDEGFYLNAISYPYSYLATTSQFGFIYHLLLRVLDGSVVYFRQSNFLIMFSLSWWLFYSVLNTSQGFSRNTKIAEMTVSAALAMGLFSVLKAWIPTPNYNLLNLSSMLIICIGLVKIGNYDGCKNNAGYLLIGAGGWLCFMAKPSSAAILALFIMIWLSIAYIGSRQSREHIIRGAVLAAVSATSLLLLSFLLTSGSIADAVEHLRSGLENGKLLVGESWVSSDLLMRGQLGMRGGFSVMLLAVIIIVLAFSVITFLKTIDKMPALEELTKITAIVTLLVIASAIILNFLKNPFVSLTLSEQSAWTWSIIGIILAAVLIKSDWSNMTRLKVNRAALIILFMVFPYVYAFGSTNNYYHLFAQVPIFGVLALIFLVVNLNLKNRDIIVFLIACVSLIIAFINVHTGITKPYRQPSGLISEGHGFINYGRLKGVRVQKSVAEYLNLISLQANSNNFSMNTPMIDLTGASPGTLYAIGAKSLGAPWLLGGYRGSKEFAIKLLSRSDPDDLERAWLLIETNTKKSLCAEILSYFGKNFHYDYELVVEVILPRRFGGRKTANVQRLYKPILTGSDN